MFVAKFKLLFPNLHIMFVWRESLGGKPGWGEMTWRNVIALHTSYNSWYAVYIVHTTSVPHIMTPCHACHGINYKYKNIKTIIQCHVNLTDPST